MSTFAAIWDVDGTLVDTAELHYEAWVAVMAELGRPFARDDFARTFGRRNPDILRTLIAPDLDDAAATDLGHRKETRYREASRRAGVSLLPGVAELLSGLRAAGWLQAVGSSAPRANLEMILDLTATRDYFGAVIASEDTSRGKPDPQVFQVAAQRLGVPAERCVVFEDAVAGVQAANAAGMKCVAVRFVGHHPQSVLQTAGADRVVECLTELSAKDVARLLVG